MRHLFALMIIVLLVFVPSCKFFRDKGLFHRKADILSVWQIRQDSIRIADSIKKVQYGLLAIERAKLDSAMKAVNAELEFGSKYKYNIIVGSFITPEYAKGLTDVYRAKGYDARIIKMEGSRFELVSAESHESFRKAVARLKEFQDTTELDSWMYIVK
jgi:hypothetical protein